MFVCFLSPLFAKVRMPQDVYASRMSSFYSVLVYAIYDSVAQKTHFPYSKLSDIRMSKKVLALKLVELKVCPALGKLRLTKAGV